jgi:DNA-binding response OmpR family regulator
MLAFALRRLLLVDDDRSLASILATALEEEGYSVTQAANGLEGLRRFEDSAPDLVLLDVLMPEMDGLEVCRRIRRASKVPIILLTSRAEDVDKVTGLESGADDYVTKPFSTRELVARIRAIARRVAPTAQAAAAPAPSGLPQEMLSEGLLTLDSSRFEVRWRERPVTLTRSEFLVLQALVKHRGIVLGRERLLDLVRGGEVVVTDRTVDSFVKRIRKKLKQSDPAFDGIETVIGVGYRYRTDS